MLGILRNGGTAVSISDRSPVGVLRRITEALKQQLDDLGSEDVLDGLGVAMDVVGGYVGLIDEAG